MQICKPCQRDFRTAHALRQHRRDAHIACRRCNYRVFASEAALDAHVRYSPRHHVCEACPEGTTGRRDFGTADALRRHEERRHDFGVCGECDDGEMVRGLSVHLAVVHHWCAECGEFFQSDNNLRMHEQVHWDADVRCPGCPANFISQAAWVLHVERNNCPSGATLGLVDRLAIECGQARAGHDAAGYRLVTFTCPECTPAREFRQLSGLAQHVTHASSCGASLENPSELGMLLELLRQAVRDMALTTDGSVKVEEGARPASRVGKSRSRSRRATIATRVKREPEDEDDVDDDGYVFVGRRRATAMKQEEADEPDPVWLSLERRRAAIKQEEADDEEDPVWLQLDAAGFSTFTI